MFTAYPKRSHATPHRSTSPGLSLGIVFRHHGAHHRCKSLFVMPFSGSGPWCLCLAELGCLFRSGDAQRQFNGKFLEELRTNSSKRMAWTAQDRVAMLKWLANGRHSKDTLREDELLSKLAVSMGIEPAKRHKKHRIVLKREMLSSMEYTLQTLKTEGRVSKYWDPSTRKKRLRWPEDLVSEILGEISTLLSVLERILRDSTPEEEVAPSEHNSGEMTAAKPKAPTQPTGRTTEPIVIDDDDDEDDFLDLEGDIEMGDITTSLAKTALSNEVWML